MQIIQYACPYNTRQGYLKRAPLPECAVESREYLELGTSTSCAKRAYDVPGWPFPAQAACSRPRGHSGVHLCQEYCLGHVYARWYDTDE